MAFARTEASPKSFIHAIKFAFKNSASLGGATSIRHFSNYRFLSEPFHYSSKDRDSADARVRHQTLCKFRWRRDFSQILPWIRVEPIEISSDSAPLIRRALATRVRLRKAIANRSAGRSSRMTGFFFSFLSPQHSSLREAWF